MLHLCIHCKHKGDSSSSSLLWTLKPQVAKSDINCTRHRSISPLGGLGRREGKKVGWRAEREREKRWGRERGRQVSRWRGGVIGLRLCQVCFSHKHTHPLLFHGGVGGGVKNDEARHWSRHDRRAAGQHWVPTRLTGRGWRDLIQSPLVWLTPCGSVAARVTLYTIYPWYTLGKIVRRFTSDGDNLVIVQHHFRSNFSVQWSCVHYGWNA